MILKNKAEFQFESFRETVKIEQIVFNGDDSVFDAVELTVNAWMDNIGGSDGESVIMTLPEFQEFIDACQRVLDEAKDAE